MYGYISVNASKLSDEQKSRYKSYYCGLCRILCKKYGTLASLTLSYDLTFLYIILSSLYESKEEIGASPCVAHPFKKNGYIINKFADYTADISIIMAYYKLLDDKLDDKSIKASAALKLLEKSFDIAVNNLPRQAFSVKEGINRLTELEKGKCPDPDTVSDIFGNIMGEVFVYDENDIFAPVMRQFGKHLGEFIYLMDAEMDLQSDIKHNNYNPFIYFYDGQSTDDLRLTILKMTLEECTRAFEKLPIVDNIDLIHNVLYSGVWAKYAANMKKNEEKGGEKLG